MDFDHAFSVAAPIDAVWTTLTDIRRVAPCLPNARVTRRVADDSYDVEVMAAVGPFEITSQGNITLAERDDAAHREVLNVVANDADGERLATATVTIVLTPAGATTDGAVRSSVEFGGIGSLVARDTLDQAAAGTLQTFAANLETLVRRRSAR